MKAMIPVENEETLSAVRGFLQALLENGVVDALLVPMRTPAGAVTPALVSNPELLTVADPLAPVMPSNAATWAGKLSIREPRATVGVVLRSCELRALIELVKLQQASTDDLVLIAVDCAGTYEVPEYPTSTFECVLGVNMALTPVKRFWRVKSALWGTPSCCFRSLYW